MTCLECQHWNLREASSIENNKRSGYNMAKQGLGLCNVGPKWLYRPHHHSCNERKQEDGDKILKRIDWLRKRGMIHER